MANNVNAPFGLRPYSSISGGPWTEKLNEYYIFAPANGIATYNTSIFTGDPVQWVQAAGGRAAGYNTIERYTMDTATVVNEVLPVLGVFMGCKYTTPTGALVQSSYWPASTVVKAGSTITALVIDDPDVVFDIQVSTATNLANDARFGGTTDQAATLAFFGQNFGFGLAAGGGNILNPTSGSTSTGQSAVYLNIVGTAATDRIAETLPLKALGYTPNPKNVIWDATTSTTANKFLNVRVVINNHVYRAGTAGAAV